VAALAVRLRYRYVTVRPDPTVGSSGHCWVGRWPRHLDLEHDRPERLEPRVRKEIITAFGGGTAEAFFRGRHSWQRAEGDWAIALGLADAA
jgi:hypothetical protein